MIVLNSAAAAVAAALVFATEAASVSRWAAQPLQTRYRLDERAATASRSSRRAGPGYLTAGLTNYHAGYGINVSIGRPAQPVTLLLSIFDVQQWVSPRCSAAAPVGRDTYPYSISGVDGPLSDPKTCDQRGAYDPRKSNTSSPRSSLTDLSYGGVTNVTFRDYGDDLSLAGFTLQDWTIGVVDISANAAIGVIGLGRTYSGYDDSSFSDHTNQSVLRAMAAQGVINSPAFSLSLGDDNRPGGSIIFGGVDKSKYTGPLVKVPMENITYTSARGNKQFLSYYTITAGSVGFAPPGSKLPSKNYTLPGSGSYSAVLETDVNGIFLPGGLASQLCGDLGGKNNSYSCSVDCGLRDKTGGLTFGFGGQSITVSYQNLVTAEPGSDNKNCTLDVGDGYVSNKTSPQTYTLGLPFLRSAYAVFDLDNLAVHVAQAADCGSNIVAIGKGPDSVPAAKGDCAASAGVHASRFNIPLLVLALLTTSILFV